MDDLVHVNLHCHSRFSDGVLEPEELARRLAKDGVRFAALTDHDTVGGLRRFQEAVTREGIGFIPGAEILARGPDGIVHLLAYGFDPDDPALARLLETTFKAARPPDSPAVGVGLEPDVQCPPAREVIRVIHDAGGCTFLAHPLSYERDLVRLKELVTQLAAVGLDGIEAVYAPYGYDKTSRLISLARECKMLIAAGSDYHSDDIPHLSHLGVDLPQEHWKAFRAGLFEATERRNSRPASVPPVGPAEHRAAALDRTGFFLRILVPTLLAIGLLVVPVFAYIIPAFENALLARKREMIRELTNSAASILAEYHVDERNGRMGRAEAQRAAIERVRDLRYGKEGKDYFWITDMHPRMVVHPYRTDLNGQDLSDFRDPNGNRVFVEFARLVKERHEGYHEYVWQWKDDPGRLAPKQSYVKSFPPWGWVIGTGLYIEDVRAETSTLSQKIVRVFLGTAVLIAMLLLFVAQQSFRIERQRYTAENALRESFEKYRSLVEASQEGMMIVMGGRPTYANHTLLSLLGYAEREWGLLDLEDIVLPGPSLVGATAWLADATRLAAAPEPSEAKLRKKDGNEIDVLLTAEPMIVAGKSGFILVARDLSAHKGLLAALDLSYLTYRALAETLRAAVLRVDIDRRMRVLEANAAAAALLGSGDCDAVLGLALCDVVGDAGEFEAFRRELLAHGQVRSRGTQMKVASGIVTLSLAGVVVRDTRGKPQYCYVIAEEAGARQRELSERDALLADLQTLLLKLSEPVDSFMRSAPQCELQATVAQAAALMEHEEMSGLIVAGPDGAGIGIVTDSDFRSRVVARGAPPERPIHQIMSSPLVAVPPGALGYEAVLAMREANVQHVAVRDVRGRVAGIIRSKELFGLEWHPLVLMLATIRNATHAEDLLSFQRRMPIVVRALVDAGAKPSSVCRTISTATDALAQRFIALAIDELGETPVPFAFITLGSNGREEQTLVTDQDNAIFYNLPPGGDERTAQAYFRALGDRVCGWLDRAGLPECKGGIMAKNPRWCVSLPAWKDYFAAWIGTAEPQNLLEFNSFFDFRCIFGHDALTVELRDFIHAELARTPSFFLHLAQNAIAFKPPLGFFGNIVTDADRHGSQKTFNSKDAITPIVAFARLYALRYGVTATNTQDRMNRLREVGALTQSTHAETSLAFQILMSLRLRNQAEASATGQTPTNQVNIKSLTEIEETTLKQVFAHVVALQRKVSFDFLGGA